MKVVYPNGHGANALLFPNLDCGLTVEEIAIKDVPNGIPFKILDDNDVPSFEILDLIELDYSAPDGYGTKQDNTV